MDLKKLPLFGKPKFLQVPSEDPEEGIIPTKPRVTRVPWLTALLTVICIALAFLFQIRWAQPISQWPIDLPMRRYTFVDHPSLRDFDDAAAGDRWGGMVWKKWWNTEWRDNTGRRFPRGIDVFHKMHCIIAIREEFAKLATNEARDEAFQPRDEAEDEKFKLEFNRNHLEHCFDFLRQVNS